MNQMRRFMAIIMIIIHIRHTEVQSRSVTNRITMQPDLELNIVWTPSSLLLKMELEIVVNDFVLITLSWSTASDIMNSRRRFFSFFNPSARAPPMLLCVRHQAGADFIPHCRSMQPAMSGNYTEWQSVNLRFISLFWSKWMQHQENVMDLKF